MYLKIQYFSITLKELLFGIKFYFALLLRSLLVICVIVRATFLSSVFCKREHGKPNDISICKKMIHVIHIINNVKWYKVRKNIFSVKHDQCFRCIFLTIDQHKGTNQIC